MGKHSITISRTDHIFSSSHFLADMGKCERLHGHNYHLDLKIAGTLNENDVVIDFNLINPMVKEIVDSFDHFVLVASLSDRYSFEKIGNEIEVKMKNKRYLLPTSDVKIVDIKSTTVENLSKYIAHLLFDKMKEKNLIANIAWIDVSLGESSHQYSRYRIDIDEAALS